MKFFIIISVLLFAFCSDLTTDDISNGTFLTNLSVTPSADITIATNSTQKFTLTGKTPYSYEVFANIGTVTQTTSNTFTYTSPAVEDMTLITFTGADGSSKTIKVTIFQPAVEPSKIFGLELWLKGETITVANGQNVTQWNDSSGNNRHFDDNSRTCYNATCNIAPIYRSNCLNGNGCVEFPGLDKHCLSTEFDASLNAEAFTIISISSATTDVGGDIFRNLNGSDGFRGYALTIASSKYSFYTSDNGIAWIQLFPTQNSVTLNQWEVFTLAIDNDSIRYLFRGKKLQTQYSGEPYWNNRSANHFPFLIGSNSFKGKIQELMIFSKALSQTEREGVLNYLQQKYPSLML